MATDETTSRSQPEAVLQQPGEAEATIRAVPATFVGMPPTAQTFYAVVNAGGTVARGFGVVSATAFGGGNYEVIFSHDVTGSAYIATIGLAGSDGVSQPGQISVVGRSGKPNGGLFRPQTTRAYLPTGDST